MKTELLAWGLSMLGLIFFLLYAGSVLALYWLQGRWVYPGERRIFATPLYADKRFVWLSFCTADGVGLTCRYCPPLPGGTMGVLLLHGNGEDLQQRSAIAERLADEGLAVLQAEYRGFAGNLGKPSEQGLYQDGLAALNFLRSTGLPVVIHGYSLGSGVAVHLAWKQECAGLILEAPFTSLVAVAQWRLPWLPVRRLLRDRYDSLSKISHIQAPLLIYGGDADKVIAPAQFQQLFQAANEPKELLMVSGAGHVNAWKTGGEQAVLRFLHTLATQR